MEQWKEYTLGEIAKFSQGIQVDIENQSLSPKEGYVRFIRIVDFTKGNEPIRYIAKPKEQYLTRKDDIVMIRYGSQTAGLVVKSFSGAIANNMFKISLDEDIINKKFAYYVLSQKSIFSSIRNSQSSSTMPAITFEIASKIHLYLPNLDEQKRIADFLSSLDDKIELNRQINDNLELQAQALFKSWFVDFEPFKDGEFVDSELGMIPKGLQIKKIGEIPHRLESGRRPKGGASLKGVPSIGAENIKGLGYYDYSKTKYIPNDFAKTISKGKVNGYELLIYKDGGKPGYFIPNFTIFGDGFPYDEMFINEHVFSLDFFDTGYNIFAYFYMQTPYIMNQLNSIGGKAAIPGINSSNVESLPIFTLDNEYIKEFGDLAKPLIKKILHNCRANKKLSQLRDTLLPRLMSGELKINEINC